MTISDFLRTLYLGDRACKSIVIDGWNSTVRVQVDCISRVRDASGSWNFYTDEDISDGFLVFAGVTALELRGDGWIPNDAINSVEVIEVIGDVTTVELSVDSVGADGVHHEVLLRLRCKELYLEDPARPGAHIDS